MKRFKATNAQTRWYSFLRKTFCTSVPLPHKPVKRFIFNLNLFWPMPRIRKITFERRIIILLSSFLVGVISELFRLYLAVCLALFFAIWFAFACDYQEAFSCVQSAHITRAFMRITKVHKTQIAYTHSSPIVAFGIYECTICMCASQFDYT